MIAATATMAWHRFGVTRLAVTGMIMLLALPAAGQMNDRMTIDQRLQQAAPDVVPGAAATPAGESPLGTLLLLREREFFTVAINGGSNYTSNAFLRDRGREGDVTFALDLSLRAETEIAERYQVFAEAAVFGLHYADNDELNLYGLRGRFGAAMPVDQYSLAFTYSPTVAWDDSLDDRLITLHPLALSVSRQFVVGPATVLIPSLSGGYTFTNPGDFSVWNASAAISAIWVASPELAVLLAPGVSYRHYKDYFEEVTGKARKDWTVDLRLVANYTPTPEWLLQLSLGGGLNNSTVDPLDYGVFDIGPAFRFARRF